MEHTADMPKNRDHAVAYEDRSGGIGRRKFLKVVGTGVVAGTAAVRSLFDPDLVPSASAEEPEDSADRAARAAADLARRSPGVTLRILLEFYARPGVTPVAEQWTKETGIRVGYIEVPALEINPKGLREADIALSLTFGIPGLAASGVLVDLTDLAKQYNPDREAKGCEALYTVGDFYQGRLYGLCIDGDAYLMFYRKDLLDNRDEQKRFADTYGYLLKVPATWKELDDMVRFFHRPDKGLYGGLLFRNWDPFDVPSAQEWVIRYHAKGHYLFDDNMNPQINNDTGVKALEDLIALTPYLDPGARTNRWPQNAAAYKSGRAFASIGWGGSQKLFWDPLKSKVYGKLGFGMTPGGMLGGKLLRTPSFLPGHSLVVSRYSPVSELAYLFCQYAYSPRMSTLAVRDRAGFIDPFRECHFTDPIIRQIYGDGYLKVHRETLSLAFPDLYLRGHDEYWNALNRNLGAADNGYKRPKVALDDTVTAWDRITERIGRDRQIAQWQFLKSQYPAHLRAVLS